jgi:hypothetical protein
MRHTCTQPSLQPPRSIRAYVARLPAVDADSILQVATHELLRRKRVGSSLAKRAGSSLASQLLPQPRLSFFLSLLPSMQSCRISSEPSETEGGGWGAFRHPEGHPEARVWLERHERHTWLPCGSGSGFSTRFERERCGRPWGHRCVCRFSAWVFFC